MNRSGYVDDGFDRQEEMWAFIRYRGAVNSAIRGHRGQQLLREMAAALDAMPEKRLIAEELVADNGQCCALGAVALARGLDVSGLNPEEADLVAARFNIAEAMAREIAFINDSAIDPLDQPEARPIKEQLKAEERLRWRIVRDWVDRNIRTEEAAA